MALISPQRAAKVTISPRSPNHVLTLDPCLSCMSEKELLAVIVEALAQDAAAYANDKDALLKASACYTCASDKQLLQIIATVLVGYYLGGLTVTQIRARINCLLCGDKKRLKAAIAYLLTGNSLLTNVA